MIQKFVIIYLVITVCFYTVVGQATEAPIVGKPMADRVFENVRHYKKQRLAFSDFRGKWLMVYYWSSHCRSAIMGIPKIDKIQRQYQKDMEVVLLGCSNVSICYGDGLEDTYERLRKKMKFNLVGAFDANIVTEWEWYAAPRVLIIDPKGIVRVITDGRDLTAEKIGSLLKGEDVSFFDPENPYPTNVEGELIMKSSLQKWSGEGGGSAYTIEEHNAHFGNGYRARKVRMHELYNIAYAGMLRWFLPDDSLYARFSFFPVLETKDSALFLNKNSVTGEGYYNYDLLATRKLTTDETMIRIQNDLRDAFGYSVRVERREMPIWKLVATNAARENLRSKGGRLYFSDKGASGGVAGFTMRNIGMDFFMAVITKYVNEHKYPYLDETGIDTKIDIKIDALLSDFTQVKSELNKNGLDLVKGKMQMNVVIISD